MLVLQSSLNSVTLCIWKNLVMQNCYSYEHLTILLYVILLAFETFCNILYHNRFCKNEFLDPCTTPKLKDHPLLAVCNHLCGIFSVVTEALMDIVLNLWVPQKVENYLKNWASICLSSRTVFHGVTYLVS